MNKKNIISTLTEVKHNNQHLLSKEDNQNIDDAITLIKNQSKKEDIIKAIDILLKLLGVGSNFFQ
jgi:hypothetical protein